MVTTVVVLEMADAKGFAEIREVFDLQLRCSVSVALETIRDPASRSASVDRVDLTLRWGGATDHQTIYM